MPVISGSDSRSGYLNLPPRVQLRERDSATGSYPTMARTGDPDFSGNKPVKFDDSRTVIFSDDVTVSYPTLLQPAGQSLKFITGSLASPNSGSDILATGTVRKGIADQFAFFDNSEQLGPFKEHLRVVPNEGAFYLTGTDPNVLPGFSSRLGSKTQITIEFEVTGSTDVRFQTGSSAGTVGVNSGLAYYNWSSQGWDVVGDLSTGSNVDYMRYDPQERVIAPLAFNNHAPIVQVGEPFADGVNQAMSGYPTDYCGFPFANQFSPSDDQALRMSGSIASPMLVEKVEVVFSASYRFFEEQIVGNGPDTATMFLLNNFGKPSRSHTFDVRSSITSAEIVSKDSILRPSAVVHTDASNRDLIWYGIMVRDTSDPKTQRDLNLRTTTGTGSYAIKAAVRPPPKYESAAAVPFRAPRNQSAIGNFAGSSYWAATDCNGFRNGYGLSSGRSYGRSYISVPVSRSFDLIEATSYNVTGTLNILEPFPDTQVSPYLLFPDDHLTLGFSCQPFGDNQQYVTFRPGKYRLTLYGSQIRDGKEFHDTSNQPLNSDAIHEALHFDNPTIDQFQVEPLTSYSGSYIDDIISGSMAAGTRGVVGSIAAGTQGVTGSLLRGLRVTDRRERFYDTLLPSFYDYYTNPNTGIREGGIFKDATSTVISILSPTVNYTDDMQPPNFSFRDVTKLTGTVAQEWLFSYPFESKYDGLERNLISNDAEKFSAQESVQPSTLVLSYFVTESQRVLLSNEAGNPFSRPQFDSPVAKKFLFGFGDGFLSQSNVNSSSYFPNAPSLTLTDYLINPVINTLTDPVIRGWKYGVKNALPEFSTLVTRYDRYGQFRDMLEQRPDSRFSTGETTTDAPVTIRFVSPSTGARLTSPVSSSNKSEFATSSLPYFDGVARN